MPEENKKHQNKYLKIYIVSIVAFVILSLVMLTASMVTSVQAKAPAMPKITFVGEYKIAQGEWAPIVADKHIPANQGTVTLKGYFRMEELNTTDPEKRVPQGTVVSLYFNHIYVEIYENDKQPAMIFDTENKHIGEDSCGQMWAGYHINDEFSQDVEIVIKNPHKYGNATAVDDLLDSMYVYATPFFEKMASGFGKIERGIGLVAIIMAFITLGTALFSAFLHTKFGKELAIIGLAVLFGGIYFLFSSEAVYFWNDFVIINTISKGVSPMFYMLFVFMAFVGFMNGKSKKIALATTVVTGVVGAVCVLVPMISSVYFYDTIIYWSYITAAISLVMLACVLVNLKRTDYISKIVHALAVVVIFCFVVDVFATGFGWWQGGLLSKNAFIVTFVMQIVVVLQIIPRNINAAVKAKELEAEKLALDAELAQSRISTMISQIRPHFIYNTLGSIEQLCETEPSKAGELVHNFAKYLRGNFGELDNPNPIYMSQEMEHVKYYISIENVRFPDMTFTFEMNSGDFKLPALTIQPIVENAIKHGLMKLQKGGSIWVTSYETESHFVVGVQDNGVGFDTGILLDERKHIGLRNIRERLKAMVNGSLEIESAVGKGTRVLIKIPKEEQNDSNSR